MAGVYGLTREMADEIVAVVAADAGARAILHETGGYRFFSPVGHAGTACNFANFLHEMASRPFDRAAAEAARDEGDREACTGVAEVTSQALIRAGKKRLPFLEGAGRSVDFRAIRRRISTPPPSFRSSPADATSSTGTPPLRSAVR